MCTVVYTSYKHRMKILLFGMMRKENANTGGFLVDWKYSSLLNELGVETTIFEAEKIKFAEAVLHDKTEIIINIAKDYDIILFDAAYFIYFLRGIKRIKEEANVDIYACMHHYLWKQFNGIKSVIFKYFEEEVLKKCEGILFAGEYSYRLSEKCKKFERNRLKYLGIGVEKEAVSPVAREDSIVFIGHVIPRKGVHYLLNAVYDIKRKHNIVIKTNVIGNLEMDPKYVGSIRKKIHRYGLDDAFFLLGRVDDRMKEEVIRKSSIMVFPSLCEGHGIVLYEVMKYGIPAIVFDNSALPYTVKNDKNGMVVKNKSYHDLSDGIYKVMRDKELYNRLSEGALETYRNALTWDKVKENLSEWIETIDSTYKTV